MMRVAVWLRQSMASLSRIAIDMQKEPWSSQGNFISNSMHVGSNSSSSNKLH